MDWLSSLFNVHKLPFKVLAWVSAVSGILVFAPNWLLERFSLNPFLATYRSHISIIFIGATALVAVNALGWLSAVCALGIGRVIRRRGLREVVAGLDHAEKAVLREFFIQGKNTVDLPMDDSAVVGLESKWILKREGDIGCQLLVGLVFPYAIRGEARALLTAEVLEIPRQGASAEMAQNLLRSRPAFVREIERHKDLRRW